MTITVLVVDDSALIRKVLSQELMAEGDIRVVGTAEDPVAAREMIKTLDPDVITLDIEMPNMNGLAFLDKLMRLRPTPVVMVSTLTSKGASETLLALELGAVDFAQKPGHDLAGGIEGFGAEVRRKVRAAAQSDVKGRALAQAPAPDVGIKTAAGPAGSVIALGASTGGVEAIRAVLARLPADCPPVVIAQHMPAGFTGRFADRLDEVTGLAVREAEDRGELRSGHAYVAPGNFHLRVERRSSGLISRLGTDDPVSGHRPSVDVLFQSVAGAAGPLAVGAILTGMGRDGAAGLKAMRDAGAFTMAQSKSSALIWGMPRAAVEAGAAVEEAAVEAIPARLAAALLRLRSAA